MKNQMIGALLGAVLATPHPFVAAQNVMGSRMYSSPLSLIASGSFFIPLLRRPAYLAFSFFRMCSTHIGRPPPL